MKIDFENYTIEGDFKFTLDDVTKINADGLILKNITFGYPPESPLGNWDKERIAELVSEKLKQDFKNLFLNTK